MRPLAARPGLASAAPMLAVGMASLVAAFAQPARSEVERPQVTVIADSVLTAVAWNDDALAILEDGLDLRLEVAVCRTLTGVSCPFEGVRPPTLVDLAGQLGSRLGPTVVVEVGYSDAPERFADGVERSIEALLAASVQRILWVNLHVWRPHYAGMNATIAAVAKRHPEVTVVDWATYSAGRYSWFQGDGVHLTYEGAIAIARLLNLAVVQALAPRLLVTTARLPAARVGVPYAAQLSEDGGVEPSRWRVTSAPLPRGLRLRADGSISGTPRSSGRFKLTFRVTDGLGRRAERVLELSIARRRG